MYDTYSIKHQNVRIVLIFQLVIIATVLMLIIFIKHQEFKLDKEKYLLICCLDEKKPELYLVYNDCQTSSTTHINIFVSTDVTARESILFSFQGNIVKYAFLHVFSLENHKLLQLLKICNVFSNKL